VFNRCASLTFAAYVRSLSPSLRQYNPASGLRRTRKSKKKQRVEQRRARGVVVRSFLGLHVLAAVRSAAVNYACLAKMRLVAISLCACLVAALRNAALPRRSHRCGASRYESYRASAALARRPLAAATDAAEADAGGVWDSRAWRLTFDVGRTEGDESMPEDWAASGARMAFSVDVEVSADDASSKDNEVGRGALALRVTNEPEFVGEKGVQRVAVSNEGGWRIDHNDVLRCWLDVESAAARNDVSLAPGRCYFEAAVWRSPGDLAAGRQKLAPLVADTRKAQDELERALDHNEGDRRLDGSDLIETAKAYGDVAGLVGKRDGALRRQREAELDLRLPATDPLFGRWPGAGGPVGLAPTRLYGLKESLFGDEHLALGTWRIKPK
jgi:hypothetical protein